jgi:hypothetical protein
MARAMIALQYIIDTDGPRPITPPLAPYINMYEGLILKLVFTLKI